MGPVMTPTGIDLSPDNKTMVRMEEGEEERYVVVQQIARGSSSHNDKLVMGEHLSSAH